MRIEPGSLKPCNTELTPECSEYISRLRRQEGASPADFATNLEKLTEWSSVLGKTEMSRWAHVLNDCDAILEQATTLQANGALAIDNDETLERPVIAVLKFTCLLFESTFSRSIYRSMERLQTLLESRKMHVVVQTLRLLLVISKSSRYITHHVAEADRRPLQMRLIANTEESWNAGGKWKLKMADLCVDGALPAGEAHLAEMRTIGFRTPAGTSHQFVAGESTPYEEAKSELKKRLDDVGEVEESEKVLAMTKLRLAYTFDSLDSRLHCVMARLISISVLFYSRCLLDEWRINCLVSDCMVEQICALLQLSPSSDASCGAALVDTLKTEALKTLASVVFLEKQTKIQLIVDCLGLGSYHGSTPALVRSCVERLKSGAVEAEGCSDGPSVNFITSLFSLVYHLAGFEAGGSALTRSSMVASLLGVVKAYSLPDSQISFVTRAVRIIDILTGIEVQEFNTNDGMAAIVDRFVHEVGVCRKHIEEESKVSGDSGGATPLVVCHQQRAALMKSLMNFLKRAVADTNYAAQIRRIMECELPTALAHLVQNSQYYGASLLHCAIHLTTSFIYQEPAQLTHLQDKGLTDALLDSILLNEKFPISRDIVNALPNICSALCLNERGLKAFNEKQPLERIFRIIFSTKFLGSLRKRKSEIQECASSLGSSFDELMRHQPTLRKDLISALVKVVDAILATGKGGDRDVQTSSSTPPAIPAQVVWTVGKNVPEESSDAEDGEKKPPAAQVCPPPTFQFCFQAVDGSLILPLADYAVMLGTLVDYILNNRAAQENSNLMLEAGIQSRMVEFLNFPRPYSSVQQWPYLQSVSNILRHLLSQTNKTDAFEPLISKLSQQLQLYSRASSVQEVHTRDRLYLLNRMGPMVAVLHNYLLKATGVNNVHDTRALLLSYFTSSETGKEFINQLFECYADMNWDLLLVAGAADPGSTTPSSSQPQPPPATSSDASTPVDASSSASADVPQPPAPTMTTPVMNPKRSTSVESSLERNINASTAKIQKHIGELIYLLGRTFCFSAVNRLRRGLGLLDPAQCKSAQRQLAETLFIGMGRLMVIDEENLRGVGSGAHIASVLALLKRLLFDDPQGHHFMRPFFFKSHCHRAFFALGEWLIDNVAREDLAAGLGGWLSIMPRLVSASSAMQQPRARMEQRSVVDGFDWKKYLNVTHRDALHTLVQLFKTATSAATATERRGEIAGKVMVEKVLVALQSLVRGMIQINETEKKANVEPDLDVLLREIDMDKVQRLVEMGFSQSDAVDALLVHNSVPEAAEYLMDRQAASQTSAAFSTLSSTAAIRSSSRVITSSPAVDAAQPTVASTAPAEPAITLREALEETLESIDGVPIQRQSQQQNEPSSSSTTTGEASEAAATTGDPPTALNPQGESTQPPSDALTAIAEQPPVASAGEEMDTSDEPSATAIAIASSSQAETQPVATAVPQPSSSKALAPSSADDFSQALEELREAKSVDFKEAIEQICSGVIPHCLALGHDETLVYAIAELVYVFVGDPVALALVEKTLICELITDLHAGLNALLQSPEQKEQNESRFRSLLHLFCLLWQGFEATKLYSKLPPTLYSSIVELLVKLAGEENSLESTLIPHLVLFIDMYEKERRLDHRQQLFNPSVDKIQWCYHVNEQRYDSPAEWRDYPAMCSAQLNQAFRDGKSVVKIAMNEKTYLVNFVDMTQRLINTGDVPSLVRTAPVYAKAKLTPTFELEKVLESEEALNNASEQHKQVATVVTQLLLQSSKSNVPLSSQTAYSLLSLLLRLLSLRGTVGDFIKSDGIATLLKLECKERMFLMQRIVVLVTRLCVDDDEESVRASFEQIVQSAVSSSTIPFGLTEPSSQTRGWMQRTRRQQREWKAMMRMFAPLAVRAPKIHADAIRKTVCLRNEEMALEPASAVPSTAVQGAAESRDMLKGVVERVVDELLHTDWPKTRSRVLGPSELLKLLAELVRSYPSTSTQLIEAVHEKKPIVHWIIDRFLLHNDVVITPGDMAIRAAAEEKVDISLSAKALLSNLISCSPQSSAKANEVLVGEVKSLLHSIINTHEQRRRDAAGKQQTAAESKQASKEAIQQLCNKVSSLVKLIMLLRESATTTPTTENAQRREIPKQYALIKQIHKKALVVDFTKALWHLPLREKVAAETTNCVLRMLETIARDLCHISAVSRAATAAAATNTTAATSGTVSVTTSISTSANSSAPAPVADGVNAITSPVVAGVEGTGETPTSSAAPATTTNPVATVAGLSAAAGEASVEQPAQSNAERAPPNEEDEEMAEFSEHVSAAISTINAATSGEPAASNSTAAITEGAFDRADEDMGVAPPVAAEAQHSRDSTPRYEMYEDDHDAIADDHHHHEDDHDENADAYSSASSSPSSSSSDEGSAGEGVGGGDGMNALEHASDEEDDIVSEEDEGEGANEAHMEIEVEIGAGAVDVGDAAVPVRSRHPAGDIHTVHDPIRIDQVRMEEEDDEEDGVDEDDDAMEGDSRVITRVVNPHHHHHHHTAHEEHDDPEDEVDEDDEEEGDEEDAEDDDEDGEDGMDYDDDEAEMDLEEVLSGIEADQLVSELQHRTGRHASTHLGNLAGYVSSMLGRLPGGASAVLEAAADVRQRHRLFTLSHTRDGPSATASFSVGIPLDRYRFSAAASAAMGGPPTGVRGDGTIMSDHPLLRRPLPPISIPLPGGSGGDSSHSPQSGDNATQQQQLAVAADQAAVHLANSNYPMSLMEFLQNDEALQRIVAAHVGRTHRPMAVHGGLRRQGALRRWHPIAVPADPHNPNAPHAGRATHRLLARIMDDGYDQLHGGAGFPRDGVAAGYGDAEGLEASTDRRLTDSLIPYYYDRVADHVRLVDAQSAHYLSILLSSHLTNEARDKERRLAEEEAKKKAEADEARKKAAEETRKKVEEEAVQKAAEAAALAAAEAAAIEPQQQESTVEGVVEQPAVTSGTDPSSVAPPATTSSNSSGGENGEEDERHSAGESVDSSELSNRFAVLPTSSVTEDESTLDGRDVDTQQPLVAPPQPEPSEDPVTPQAQVSAMEVDPQPQAHEGTQPLAEEGTIAPAVAAAAGPSSGGEGTAEEPSSAENYRAILGDIDIPDGVDPAFLAALPEEIRQEVIRDHMRQQRAQRLVQAQRAAAAQSAAETTTQPTNPPAENSTSQPQPENPQEQSAPAQGDQPQEQPVAQPAAAADEEEVLDQEFLNALPPELQEEVLREHEQRINQRNRQAAAAAAAASGESAAAAPAAAPTAADHAADAAALFESLPPGLRAQVLADMDDSVVAYLPANLQAEANRLRANLHHQQAFRIAMGGGEHRGGGNRMGGTATIRAGGAARFYDGQMYAQPGAAQLGDIERGVQILDREAIATVLLVYFFDQERFNHTRLQKLLKVICLHSGTCDYVVWSLLSILHGLNNDKSGDESSDASALTGWVDTQFLVQTPLNHSERIIRFLASGEVSIHPLVKQSICTRVLDVLGQVMARNFPQHFLPDKIRLAPNSTKRWDSPPEITHFWATVKSINKKSCEESKAVSGKSACQGLKDMIAGSLEKSPLAHLLSLPSSPLIRQNGSLMDKSVKILQTIAQSIPNGTQAKVPDESIHWLMERIKGVANLMLESCTEGDGLESVKGFLFEVLRMLPEHRATLFSILYSIVEEQGARLHRDLLTLSDELKELKPRSSVVSATTSTSEGAATTSSAASEADAPTAAHQLSTLKDFTSRNSQAKKVLRSVEVISYLRNKQRQLDQQRKRALAAAAAATAANNKEKEKSGAAAAQTPTSLAMSIAQEQEVANEAADVGNLERMLGSMESLWSSLSTCLDEMSRKLDSHAVLSLQHAAEAFFLAHALCIPAAPSVSGVESTGAETSGATPTAQAASTESSQAPEPAVEEPQPSTSAASRPVPCLDHEKYRQNMFTFAEKHRSVLNQILRGNANNLMEDSAMHILTYFPKLLDFDVKRKYFIKEIRRLDSRDRYQREDVAVRIRRAHLFSDSFRELFRLRGGDWKQRFYIIFEGEEGQDAGGLLREWYSVITREVFNPMYALFVTSPGDRVTYMINPASYINPEHLDYFKFIGRVIAKAIFDNKQLDCYFTRAFYKHILNVPVRYQDIESEDPSYFKSLEFLLSNPLEVIGAEMSFTTQVEEFGERSIRDLKEGGSKMAVTDENKDEYVQLVCQMKMTGSIRKQLDAFLSGFYDIIPKRLISIFNEQELELLISGLPEIDIDDLCANSEYKGFTRSSTQIQWFWRALRSFEKEDLAKFLQFVTGTSKVPLQGFSQLEGMNGVQKFTIHMDSRSNDRLPSAHTCFNQLDLPCYDSYEQLRRMLLLAIRECSEGFAFA